MKRYFLTQGEFDKFLLMKLLPAEYVAETKFITSGGYNAAVSKARSILISSELPVIIAVDSDNTNSNRVEERRDYIFQMLNPVASPDRFKIFLFVPEIEILLFYDKNTFERLFHLKMDDTQWKYAKFSPKNMLKELLKTDDLQNFLELNFSKDIINKLNENILIQNIITQSKAS